MWTESHEQRVAVGRTSMMDGHPLFTPTVASSLFAAFRRVRRGWLCLVITMSVALGACGGGEDPGGYRLAAPPRPVDKPALPPMQLPADEAPHADLTEWWYYTGHLYGGGKRYGFELVTFQAVRGKLPRTYVMHFALTDVARKKFVYDQKLYTGAQPRGGYDLEVGGWRMGGLNGKDHLEARMQDYGIDLDLSATKPVALHDRDGVVEFGPAGDSYYYSRTRMTVRGTLTYHGERVPVTGQAWMDHQWGNFISVAGGGWDWYSVQLADGADLTVSVVRDLQGKTVLSYGTYVEPNGEVSHLSPQEFRVEATGEWTSPKTGATYPSGWRMSIPARKLDLSVTPALTDQELDTRSTTGVAYWEGAVDINGTRAGEPVRGAGYVELTGYAASKP